MSSLLILVMGTFVGCVNRTAITPQIDIVEYPPLNLPQRAGLGDTIVKKTKAYSYDELELRTRADCHFVGMTVVTFLPGKFKPKFEDERGIYFYANKFKNGPNAYYTNAGIFIPGDETSEQFAFAEKGSPNSLAILSCDNLNFVKTKVYDSSKPAIQQELVYNGRFADNIKFLYREQSDDLLKPALSQDIQYNLKEGNVIEYKGVRIEIIEATKAYLDYKVLNNFTES